MGVSRPSVSSDSPPLELFRIPSSDHPSPPTPVDLTRPYLTKGSVSDHCSVYR